jgi:hypothetical protein
MSSAFIKNRFAVSTAIGVLIFSLTVLLNRLQNRLVHPLHLSQSSGKGTPLPSKLSIPASLGLAHEIVTTLHGDPRSIQGWANVLSQGASIEGIIRGIILSTEYERLENQAPKARSKQIERLIQLAELMKWSLPPDEIRKKGITMSALTLARIATERCLRFYEETRFKKDFKAAEELYLNLVKWGIREGLHLKLPERMNPNLEYHRSWYRNAREDFRIWESVYRIYTGVLDE